MGASSLLPRESWGGYTKLRRLLRISLHGHESGHGGEEECDDLIVGVTIPMANRDRCVRRQSMVRTSTGMKQTAGGDPPRVRGSIPGVNYGKPCAGRFGSDSKQTPRTTKIYLMKKCSFSRTSFLRDTWPLRTQTSNRETRWPYLNTLKSKWMAFISGRDGVRWLGSRFRPARVSGRHTAEPVQWELRAWRYRLKDGAVGGEPVGRRVVVEGVLCGVVVTADVESRPG